MSRRRPVLGLAMLVAVASATPTAAQNTLYAAAKGVSEGSAPSSLYILNQDSAEATRVGPIEGPDPLGEGTRAYRNVTGLAFLRDGRLVATADGDDFVSEGARGAILIEIDRTTGAAEFIGLIDDDLNGTCGRMPGLTYDPVADVLYSIGRSCGNVESFDDCSNPDQDDPDDPDNRDDFLYTIDPSTGAGTPVATLMHERLNPRPGDCPITTAEGNGLAVEASTGMLFAARGNTLVAFNPLTLLGGPIRPRSLDRTGALDFDPLSGELYGATLAEDEVEEETIFVPVLNTISTSTAASTRVGETTLDGEELAGVDAIAFRGPGGCPAAPVGLACRGPGRTKLTFTSPAGKLKWKWSRGAATSLESLGDPVAGDTRYRLCWYDYADGLAELETGFEVAPGDGWKAKSNGYKYKRPGGSPPGLEKLKLEAGGSGRAKLVIKGSDLPSPELPQQQTPAVQVQLLNDAGQCWESVLGDPATQNDTSKFKDRSD